MLYMSVCMCACACVTIATPSPSDLTEHQNFFGVDENLGPIAISIRREKVPDQLGNFYQLQPNTVPPPPKNMYRVIFRTSEVSGEVS